MPPKELFMKRFLLVIVSFFLLVNGYSQNQNYIKGKAIGFSFFLSDFEAASVLKNQGVVEMFKNKNFFNNKNLTPGLAFNYYQGLSKHMDFVGTLGASFLDYPNANIPSGNTSKLLGELTGAINFKLLSDYYVVSPYFDLGIGLSNYGKNFGAFIPTGVGFQFNLNNQTFIHLNSQYRIQVTENVSNHFYHSIGISETISKRKEAPLKAVPVPVVLDRDGDGVVDSLDRCPDQPGPAALKGCPDRDGDGIPDIDDKCPDVPGIAKYNGCPIPDSDGDGINDEEDKCPNVPGVARYNGCPVPDSDGDGVNDEEDKCPFEVGPASNHGCPVIKDEVKEKINKAAQNIFFQTNSYKLLAKSFGSLKEVVQILNENPSYKISVDGYTDNTGRAEYNLTLSDQRAKSVKDYLVENGIDESRITSKGHGIDNPIADNNTAAGRAQNRRVEMTLSNF